MVIAQGGHELGFANEAPQHFLVFTFEDFDGDQALGLLIKRLIDICHASLTNQPPQFITSKGFTLQFCHTKQVSYL